MKRKKMQKIYQKQLIHKTKTKKHSFFEMVFFLRPILLLFLSSTLQATAVRSVTHYSFPPPFNTPLKLPLATLMEALQDHCETHNYQPQCPSHDHVVVIATATYGRMSKTSKCLTTDFGYTGCKSNVLIQAHHHCSGRPSCLVRLPDGMFENVTVPMCPKDLKMYLSASHHCLPVDLAACSHCYQHSNEKNFALSSSNAGYLASSMSLPSKLHSGCGLDRCPWRVHVKSGQTINLTLYDFGIATLYKNNSNTCYKYGKVLEHAFNRHSPICGGKNVTSHLYTSVSNSLEVVNYLTNASMGQYLIYYQAVGCPDYTTPIASTTKRFADKIIITCNHTLWKSWEVRCVGNKWEGEVGVCPDSAKGVAGLSLSLGVLVAIVLGIALVIGVLIVTVGIVYLKRQQRELLYPPFNPSMPHYLAHDTYYDAMDTKVINTMQRKKHQQQQDFDLQQQMLTLKKQQHLLQEQQQTLDKKAVRKAAKKGKGRGEGGRNVYTKANMEFRPLPSIPSKGSPLEDTTPHPLPPQPSFNPLHPPQTRAAQLATTTTTTTTITTTTAPLPSLTTPPTSFSPPQTNVKRTASPVVQVHVLSSGLPSSASSGTLRKPAKPVRSSSNVKDATPPTPKQPQQTLQPPPQPQPQQSLQQQQQPLQQKQLPQQQQLPLQQQPSQQQQQPPQQQQIPLQQQQQQLQPQLQQPVSQQPLPPSTQHYTMLDPLEVQQLIARLPQQQQPQYHPLLNYQQDPQQQQQQLIQQPFPPPPPLLDSDEELALRPAREGTHLLTNNNNNNNNNNNHNNNNNSNSDCLANSSWP